MAKPTRIPVPDRPRTNAQDYGFDPSFMDEFSQRNRDLASGANALRGQGDRLGMASTAAQGRATPQTDFGASQQTGAQQIDAANWLSQFAQGPQGPSAAQAQLANATNQGMAQNLALARSGTGFGESANNIANAQRQNSTLATNAANNSAILRAQEDQAFRTQQLQAMGAAANTFGGAAERQGAQSQFLTQAEQEAQAQRDALQLGLGGQSIEAQNLGLGQGIATQGLGVDAQNAQLQGRIAQGQTEANLYGTEAGVYDSRLRRDAQQREARRADRGEVSGAIAGVAGAIGGLLSDERTKTRKRSADLRARYADLGD